MSEANVAVIRQIVDAVARQDASLLLELTDPDVEWQSFLAPLREGGVYRGHDGIRQYVSDLADTFDLLQTEIEDTLTVGETTVVIARLHYRGKGSGVESEGLVGYLVKIRGGRAVLMRAFREPESALQVLGLSG